MKCESCSAPLPPAETVCAYCGTRNSVDLECLHEYTVVGPDRARSCPRCDVPLDTVDLKIEGTFLLERCPRCFGLFFDPGEVEKLLESAVRNAFTIDYGSLGGLAETHAPEVVRYGKCPVCGTLMNRVAFGARSGVVADRCKGHGVWLDGGELRRLLEWKKAGGVLLHEKLESERKEEAARLARERADGSFPSGAGAWLSEDSGETEGLAGLLSRFAAHLLS